MNKKRYIVAMLLLLFIAVLAILLYYIDSKKLKLEFVDEKKYIEFITTDEEFNSLNKKIEEKISSENIECTKVKFINSFVQDDKIFFYFIVDDDYETLFEGLYKNKKYIFTYLGSNINTTAISKYSGYTYLQIIDPEEYEKQNELDEIREKGKTLPPDDTEMP